MLPAQNPLLVSMHSSPRNLGTSYGTLNLEQKFKFRTRFLYRTRRIFPTHFETNLHNFNYAFYFL